MSPGERFRLKLERRAKQLAPDLGRELLRAWDRLAKTLKPSDIERIIQTGGEIEEALLDEIFTEVQRIYVSQTMDDMAWFGKDLGVTFGVLNPEVIDRIRTINLKMADTIKGDVRDAFRATVEEGLRQGYNPRKTARLVRDNIGLTGKQARWVENFRTELEQGQRKALNRALGRGFFTKPDGSMGYRYAHADNRGLTRRDMNLLRAKLGTKEKLTQKQIDRMVEAYRKRLTAWHSESLSRTATLDALKETQHLSTRQAISDGILDGSRMMSEWITAGDSRVRPEHQALNHKKVPYGTPFSNGEVVPGSSTYNCRCVKRDYQAREAVRQAA